MRIGIRIGLFTLMLIWILIRILLPIISDLCACIPSSAPFLTPMSPLWAPAALHGSISSFYSSWILILMRSWLPKKYDFYADKDSISATHCPPVRLYIGYMGTNGYGTPESTDGTVRALNIQVTFLHLIMILFPFVSCDWSFSIR